uniref:Secreted protein n=1 Tax=Eptatretus burgeri TaxID=7764 RepID=A0A8C4R6N1_EPTBU
MIKPLVYFRRFGLTLLLDMVIACPLSRPQPLERWLSWSIPLQPPVLQELSLLMVPDVQLVVGRHLLDDKAMAQRGVILSRNSSYMMLKVPWGVAGGNQSELCGTWSTRVAILCGSSAFGHLAAFVHQTDFVYKRELSLPDDHPAVSPWSR